MYILFAGDTYYPSGGWHDFVGTFASEPDAAIAHASTMSIDWWHVVCGGEIVSEGHRR